jgi:hypothetical protein
MGRYYEPEAVRAVAGLALGRSGGDVVNPGALLRGSVLVGDCDRDIARLAASLLLVVHLEGLGIGH